MPKDNENEPDLVEQYVARDWARIRSKGRAQFLWARCVLPFGVPTSLFLIGWEYEQLDYVAADLLTAHGLALIYLSFFFGLASAYLYGVIEWSRREEKYRKTHRRSSPPEDNTHEEK
jgi:hypothetical protein